MTQHDCRTYPRWYPDYSTVPLERLLKLAIAGTYRTAAVKELYRRAQKTEATSFDVTPRPRADQAQVT